MATEHVTIVDPDQGSGWDYASLSAWEADYGDTTGNLVTSDTIAVAKCRSDGGSADTAQFYFDGWTVDPTRYAKVWADPAESYRHNGKWDTTAYRLECGTSFYAIKLSHGMHFAGLQISLNPSAESYNLLISWYDANSGPINIDSCIFKFLNTNQYGFGIYDQAGSSDAYTINITNCVFYDFAKADWSGGIRGTQYGNGSPTFNVYNCTFHNCGVGIMQYGAGVTFTAKNCGFASCGVATSGTVALVTCSTSTPTFVDVDNDDFHLASSDTTWKDQGTDLSAVFSTDIDGETRSDAWDIGADEYVAAGESVNVSAIVKNLTLTDQAASVKLNVFVSALSKSLSISTTDAAVDIDNLALVGSRIANGSRSWLANEDADLANWNKANPLIIAAMIERN